MSVPMWVVPAVLVTLQGTDETKVETVKRLVEEALDCLRGQQGGELLGFAGDDAPTLPPGLAFDPKEPSLLVSTLRK